VESRQLIAYKKKKWQPAEAAAKVEKEKLQGKKKGNHEKFSKCSQHNNKHAEGKLSTKTSRERINRGYRIVGSLEY